MKKKETLQKTMKKRQNHPAATASSAVTLIRKKLTNIRLDNWEREGGV